MSQLAVTQDPPIATPGMLTSIEPRTIKTGLASNEVTAVEPMNFGLGVVRDVSLDDQEQVRIPVQAGDLFMGVVIFDASKQSALPEVAATQGDYLPEEAVPILRKGEIWVLTEEAVDETSPVFMRFAAGTGTILGSFRQDADTATAEDISAFAKFTSRTTGAGLVKLEINLP